MANLYVARLLTVIFILKLMVLNFKDCAADLSISNQQSQSTGIIEIGSLVSIQESNSWDKSKISPEQYQRKFCGKTCLGEDVRISDNSCPDNMCFDCMCKKPACELYGICCPSSDFGNFSSADSYSLGTTSLGALSASNSENPNSQSSNSQNEESLGFPVLKCEATGKGDKGYLYIHSCPSHFQDSETRKLCEQDNDQAEDKAMTLDKFARVTDTKTEVTYHNKYCALCNGVAESYILQWNVSVNCEHFLYVYGATTFDQFLSKSLRPGSTCVVQQNIPVEYVTDCRLKWFRKKRISSCNETGLWHKHDGDVERACQQMDKRSHNVFFENQGISEMFFNNIFCAICNMRDYPDCRAQLVFAQTVQTNSASSTGGFGAFLGQGQVKIPTLVLPEPKPEKTLPFSLVLGYRWKNPPPPIYKSALKFSSCKAWEWPSPDGLCLNLHCSPGKVSKNRICVTAMPQIRGLGYKFSVWFQPLGVGDDNNNTHSENLSKHHLNTSLEYFEDTVRSQMNASSDSYEITVTVVATANESKLKNHPFRDSLSRVAIWLQVMITADKTIPRDDFEMRLASFTQSLVNDAYLKLGLKPLLVFGVIDPTPLCLRDDLTCDTGVSSYATAQSSVFADRDSFLKPDERFACQYVQFNRSDYTVELDKANQTLSIIPEANVSLKLGSIKIIFTEIRGLNWISVDESSTLRVCQEVLNSKLEKIEEQRQKKFLEENSDQTNISTVEKAQYYLAIICISASMICLILTLLTYLSFKILRNQAGLNNIFLCGSLLMAQAFLLITAHVSSPRPLCTAVGMLTHFLWLWMFVWSFICCFHMFRVFTVKTVGHTTRATCCCGPNSSLLHSVAISLVCPAAVVSLVVVISLASSGGTRTGYGMDYCYLDTNLLAGLTVVLPIGLVILANIVFFAITVFKIHTTRRKQSHAVFKASDKENLFIYMKLSSITGAFWLIQIFAEGLNIDVLRFIAIITNGLQGVFIFISYMCNKRVYNLYVQRFREKNATSASSISDSHRNETPEHESHKVSTGCSTDNARYTCTCTSNNNTQSKM